MGLFPFLRHKDSACGLLAAACGLILLTGLQQSGAQGVAGQAPTMLTMPPAPMLPGRIGPLSAESVQSRLAGELRPEDFNGQAGTSPSLGTGDGATTLAILKEDGISRTATATYGEARGAKLAVAAFEFGDATGAYSAYTFARSALHHARVTSGSAQSGKANETSTEGAETLAWAGTAILHVTGHPSPAQLAELISVLPKTGGRRGLAPLLPTYLPAGGLQQGTERYALGPAGYKAMGGQLPAELLAWDKSAEVLTAAYDAHGQGELTLMLYPTPQIAGDRGRALEKYVNGAGVAQFGTLKMRRVGPMLGMTTGNLGATEAANLVASLHLSQEVSFDKPMPLEFHAEVQKTYSLLQSITIFTGVAVLAAVLLALFLGGARAGIRVLQGKPAASEPEFLTINLRDKPKALFAGDVKERKKV